MVKCVGEYHVIPRKRRETVETSYTDVPPKKSKTMKRLIILKMLLEVTFYFVIFYEVFNVK